MASICNDERASLGVTSGHERKTLRLSGLFEQLAALAKDFKVYYKKVEGRTPTSYTMDHSAGSYVFDTKGQLRLFTRYGSGAAALAGDLRQLLKQA